MVLTETQIQKLQNYYAAETEVKFILNTIKSELIEAGKKGDVIDLPNGKLVLTLRSAGTKKQFNFQRFKEEVDDFERFYDIVESSASLSPKYIGN